MLIFPTRCVRCWRSDQRKLTAWCQPAVCCCDCEMPVFVQSDECSHVCCDVALDNAASFTENKFLEETIPRLAER